MANTRHMAARNTTHSVAALFGFLFLSAILLLNGCDSFNPTAIDSPGVPENVPPTIEVLEPNVDQAISQGESFIVRWIDSDPDDNALIDIDLAETDGLSIFRVASGLLENDTTEDRFTVQTEDMERRRSRRRTGEGDGDERVLRF